MDGAQDPDRSQREIASVLGLNAEGGRNLPALSGFPLLEKLIRTQNCLRGVFDGKPAAILHMVTKPPSSSAEFDDEHWTAIVFEQLNLPAFDCLPSTSPLPHQTCRPHLAFDKAGHTKETRQILATFGFRYQVRPIHPVAVDSSTADEEQLRIVFRAPLLAVLARYPGWRIQALGDRLLLARYGSVPMKEWPAIWQQATNIRQAFVTPPPAGEPVLTCPPGKELGRQYARLRGAMVGAAVGTVLGFFGCFILFAMPEMSSDKTGAPPLDDFGFAVSIFGGAALGALLCCVLGASGASLSYKSGTRWRPELPRNPLLVIASVVGFGFLGAGIGAALGMMSVVLLEQTLGPRTLSILAFSPFVVGQIVGGLTGYWLVNRARSMK